MRGWAEDVGVVGGCVGVWGVGVCLRGTSGMWRVCFLMYYNQPHLRPSSLSIYLLSEAGKSGILK